MRIITDYTSYKSNNNITFGRLIPTRVTPKSKKIYDSFISGTVHRVPVERETIHDLTKNVGIKRKKFMMALANRYNVKYHGKNNPEDPQFLLDIFKSIKKPTDLHHKIVDRVHGSFAHIGQIFSLAKTEKSMNVVTQLQKKVYEKDVIPIEVIQDILTSPNKKSYLNHFDEYSAYIRLNKEDKDVIKNLDKLIKNNEYNADEYIGKVNIRELFKANENIKSIFEPHQSFLEENYSDHRKRFLCNFFGQYLSYRPNMQKVDIKDILEMYRTTTPENYQLRKKVIYEFSYAPSDNANFNFKEVRTMKNMFEEMDKNKNLRQFVDKVLQRYTEIDSIQKLAEVVENVPPKKARIFSENIFDIVRKTPEREERIKALKNEVTNPFYESKASFKRKQHAIKYGYTVPNGFFTNTQVAIENGLNILKYRLTTLRAKKVKALIPQKLPYEQPQTTVIKFNDRFPWMPSDIKALPILKPTPKVPDLSGFDIHKYIDEQILKYKTENELNIVNKTKEIAKAKKLRVINDVNDIISKKLGAKTKEKQQEIYSKNATKMRLKLLPEIFASIKETSKASRANNIRPKSQNKDVVKLYQKIKGSNRKLIRYMLMKKNADGTRMFEVKDIINTINTANKDIEKMKRKDPKFKPTDEKAYFDILHEELVAKYGKLTRSKKKS